MADPPVVKPHETAEVATEAQLRQDKGHDLGSLTLNGSSVALHAQASQDPVGGPLTDTALPVGEDVLRDQEAHPPDLRETAGSSQGMREPPSKSASSHSANMSSEGLAAEIEDSSTLTISYGQNDSFTQQLMAGAMKLKSSLFRPERVSFSEIAHNPTLAKRARAEMDNHVFRGMIEGADGTLLEGRPHDLEVARLQVALDAVESDAREEAKVNHQLAQLIHLRLDAARKAVERLLGILQAVTSAEASYSRAMTAASRVKLWSEFDGPTLRAALTRLSDIPWLLGEAHASIQGRVVELTRNCQEALGQVRHDCSTTSHDSLKAHAEVANARKALHQAFLTHRTSCRAADDVALERGRTGRTSSSARIEVDPWLTESRIVAAHQSLHATQTKQRAILAAACEKVRHHDEMRVKVLGEAVETVLKSYRGNLGTDPKEEEGLREVADKVDCQQDLHHFSASASTAVSTGKQLAARQQQALDAACQELLCSPDIIRQGQMARWVAGSGKWSDCHFILTRSGFLHWLADPQEVTPLGSLNLPRCQFEAGEAPKFNIYEHQGGFFSKGKRMCFEAPSVEECCEWAIALRESIAAHRVR